MSHNKSHYDHCGLQGQLSEFYLICMKFAFICRQKPIRVAFVCVLVYGGGNVHCVDFFLKVFQQHGLVCM